MIILPISFILSRGFFEHLGFESSEILRAAGEAGYSLSQLPAGI